MSDKDKIYSELRKGMITCKQAMTIKEVCAETDREPWAILPKDESGLVGRPEASEVPPSLPHITVRGTVARKLARADAALKLRNPNRQIVVACGYRSLELQRRGFAEQMELLRGKFEDEDELMEAASANIANPTIAGHPAGAAADVTIFDMAAREYLDFGTPCGNLDSPDILYASPFIGEEAKANRRLLREIMSAQEFLPFDGEWWHFSYGDKEWAYANKMQAALYGQKTIDEIRYAR
ncbi:MAG: hypothetical protein LBL21_00175 [Rickettsiales bacterium]|jgi:D-alanyl-D-alanine dipeptidase|nr:hypothetical protein [Rickettsiales bacterium]